MNQPDKILLIRLSALGDVLLATPAARLVAERFPNARIDWLVEAPYAPLLTGNPHVRPIAYDKRGRDRGLKGWRQLRARLKSERYDLVIDLQNKPKTALLRGVAPRALVFKKRTLLQSLGALFGQDPPLARAHATRLFGEALAPLDIDLGPQDDERRLVPELNLTEAMKAEAESLFGDSARPIVGLSPGTRWPTKCWPVDKFASLAVDLSARGFELLLIGGPDETRDFSTIRAALPPGVTCRDTARLSVAGLCGAIHHCALVISGDSGPAHIAAALKTPSLTLFGPTSPERWAPRGPNAEHLSLNLACSPCSNHGALRCPLGTHACLRELAVDTVLQRALAMLTRES